MSRNILNDPTRNSGRDITNTGTRSFSNTAIEPVEITEITSRSSTIGLKGLSGFTPDKIIKVNSAGDALEYATETDTIYTLVSPLSFVSGTTTQIQLDTTLFNTQTTLKCGRFIFIYRP